MLISTSTQNHRQVTLKQVVCKHTLTNVVPVTTVCFPKLATTISPITHAHTLTVSRLLPLPKRWSPCPLPLKPGGLL